MTKRYIVVEIDDRSLTKTQKDEGGALEVVRSALDHFEIASSMVELAYNPLEALHEVDEVDRTENVRGKYCCCPPPGYSGIWAAGPCPEHRGLRARSLARDKQFEETGRP